MSLWLLFNTNARFAALSFQHLAILFIKGEKTNEEIFNGSSLTILFEPAVFAIRLKELLFFLLRISGLRLF